MTLCSNTLAANCVTRYPTPPPVPDTTIQSPGFVLLFRTAAMSDEAISELSANVQFMRKCTICTTRVPEPFDTDLTTDSKPIYFFADLDNCPDTFMSTYLGFYPTYINHHFTDSRLVFRK